MQRNRLCLPCPLEHKQLRENSNRLEIYGKGPQYLRHGKAIIEYEGKEETGSKQVLDLERVNGWVMGGPTTRCVCRQRVSL